MVTKWLAKDLQRKLHTQICLCLSLIPVYQSAYQNWPGRKKTHKQKLVQLVYHPISAIIPGFVIHVYHYFCFPLPSIPRFLDLCAFPSISTDFGYLIGGTIWKLKLQIGSLLAISILASSCSNCSLNEHKSIKEAVKTTRFSKNCLFLLL